MSTEKRGFDARLGANSAISVEEIPMRLLMRLLIEIAAAALFVVCITASSAAFAAGKSARSADGLSCGFTVPQNASPAARCAAVKRQCGGKFYASACGDRLMSAAN
jgi:hypothetical protein